MIMRRRRVIYICIAAAVLLAALIAWTLRPTKPPVSITILGYTTNHYTGRTAQKMGSQYVVCPIIAVTNHSARRLTYWGRPSSRYFHVVSFDIVRQTPLGWTAQVRGGGKAYTQQVLGPNEWFSFRPVLNPNSDQLCEIA